MHNHFRLPFSRFLWYSTTVSPHYTLSTRHTLAPSKYSHFTSTRCWIPGTLYWYNKKHHLAKEIRHFGIQFLTISVLPSSWSLCFKIPYPTTAQLHIYALHQRITNTPSQPQNAVYSSRLTTVAKTAHRYKNRQSVYSALMHTPYRLPFSWFLWYSTTVPPLYTFSNKTYPALSEYSRFTSTRCCIPSASYRYNEKHHSAKEIRHFCIQLLTIFVLPSSWFFCYHNLQQKHTSISIRCIKTS